MTTSKNMEHNNFKEIQPATDVKKVLIVEDELDLSQLLKNVLKKFGYETTLAHTIKEGMTELSENTPALLISDVNLPDGSGFSILDHAKETFPELSVIIISGNLDRGIRQRALDNGASEFLEKPFNLLTFIKAVENLSN
ncbi:response regulator [Flexithrix dorotheae]|uniref:response regulator n=1 Tax=Flexithrix dorotheae TaxID=70993 RepID=UPI00035FC833|nr:response regulator [Flexithrix dorotheae]